MSMVLNTNMNMNIQVPQNFGMRSNNNIYADINKNLRNSIDSDFSKKLEKASGAIATEFPEPKHPEIKNEPLLFTSASIPSKMPWDTQTEPLIDFTHKPIDFNVLNHVASQEKILGAQSGSLQTKLTELNKPMEILSPDKYLSKPFLDKLNSASSSIASKFPEPDYSNIYKNNSSLNNINPIMPRNEWINKPNNIINNNYSIHSFENDSWNKFDNFGLNKKSDLPFNDHSNNWDIINNLNKPEPVKYLDLNSNNDIFNRFGLDKKPDLPVNNYSSNWNIINDLNKSKPVNDYSYKPVYIDFNKPKTVNDYSSFKNNNIFKNLDLDETPTYNNYSGLNDDPLKGFKFLDINVKPEIKIPNHTTNYLNNDANDLLGFKPNLTIRDFPASGVQLHIHEGDNGTAHWRPYDRMNKIPINSYDAAMADLTLPEHIRKMLK